jgi:hypothetical protein
MEDLGKCEVCGYKARNQEEVNKWFKYACCRAFVTSLPASGVQVQCCRYNNQTGEFSPAVEDTSTNPDAFKENFIKKYEQKGCKDKPE